jgi:lipopolysaccharide/colanic/teichoic acid biosynthesis glycosyltransferase
MSSRALASGPVVARGSPRTLIVGDVPGCRTILAELNRLNGSGPAVVGQVAAAPPSQPAGWPYLGTLDVLPALLATGQVSEVAVCLGGEADARLEPLARACEARNIGLWIPVPPAAAGSTRSPWQARVKRAMDMGGAIVGLILAAPVLAITALAILIFDGRPVLFRQQRAGLRGRAFRIAKFRTMQVDADRLRDRLRERNALSGAAFKMQDDPRVTRLGGWLRRTSIDELPQLWNVLKGEMSLVGPRPHPYDDVARYHAWHLQRLSAKPGITGLWQVEMRDETDFDRWVAKDIEYIERWSIWLDISVIARTIPAVLRGTGR